MLQLCSWIYFYILWYFINLHGAKVYIKELVFNLNWKMNFLKYESIIKNLKFYKK